MGGWVEGTYPFFFSGGKGLENDFDLAIQGGLVEGVGSHSVTESVFCCLFFLCV